MFRGSRPPSRYSNPPPGFIPPQPPTPFSMPPPLDLRQLAMRGPLSSTPSPVRIQMTPILPPPPYLSASVETRPIHLPLWSTRPHPPRCSLPPRLSANHSMSLPPTQPSCSHAAQLTPSLKEIIENGWYTWLAKNETRLGKLHAKRTALRPKLPEFRSKLLRWNRLLDEIRDSRSKSLPVDPASESELLKLKEDCSDPNYLQRIQSKLRSIRKRQRYRKRRKLRLQESSDSDSVIVLPSSVSGILDYLRSSQENAQPESSDHLVLQTSATLQENEDVTVSSPASPYDDSCSEQTVFKQRLHSIHCLTLQINERISLLDALSRLRSARLTQARQRGGLFPEALDFAFNAQMTELRTALKKQLNCLQFEEGRLKTLIAGKSKPKIKQEEAVVHDDDIRTCCDHFPNLIEWKKRALFGCEYDYPEIPWRWKRFYHQADFDFADLVKIRFAWDYYSVPAIDPCNPDTSPPINNIAAESSPLLTSWILPPSIETCDNSWSAYLTAFLISTTSTARN